MSRDIRASDRRSKSSLSHHSAPFQVPNQYLNRYHEEMELEHTYDTVRLLTDAFVSCDFVLPCLTQNDLDQVAQQSAFLTLRHVSVSQSG
jgi:hypothetical protein